MKLNELSKEQLIEMVKQLKQRKKFGLVWEDKPENVVEQCKKELPVLEEVKDKEIVSDESLPVNLLIEGDNYHALSVLNYTHAGKIDVIYIDPPYNTGNKDFKYNDQFVEKEDSYRHSKWLSFMEKRLRASKNLLHRSGIIFISINDIELSALKLLCDDIFGTDNFLANLIWLNKEGGGSSDSKYFRIKHEYILVYAKSILYSEITGDEITNLDRYKESDEYIKERGKYYLQKLGMGSIQYSTSLDYEIKTPDGNTVLPKDNNNGKKACWRWSQQKLQWGIQNGFIVFKKDKQGVWQVYTKQYLHCDNEGNLITRESRPFGVIEKFSSTQGAKLIRGMGVDNFSYPKPIDLIKYLISKAVDKDSLVLDFFAGSGTTGHAVLELNKEDGGNRKFILCTNNENGIAEEVCYPRVKKVIEGYSDVEGIPANIKYFKTSFVKKSTVTDDTRELLVKKSVEMICVKEGTFKEVVSNADFKVFKDTKHSTGILFNLEKITGLKEALQALKMPSNIYVFSLTNDTYSSDFDDLTVKHKLCPIPESILEVYRKLFKE